jgi:hypothetical protein
MKAALAELEVKYRKAVISMLKTAVSFAKTIADAAALRDEGRSITGRMIGPLIHAGPGAEHWRLDDYSSWVAHWLRSARDDLGYISGKEPWLSEVKF